MRPLSTPLRRPAAASPRCRFWQGAGVCLAVLAAHGLLFTWLMPPTRRAEGLAAKQVAPAISPVPRLPPAPALPALPAVPALAAAAATMAPTATTSPHARSHADRAGRPVPLVQRAPAAVTAAMAAPMPSTPLPGAAADAGPVPAEEAPVYATRLPPPADLHYRMQRGGVAGTAMLQWRRQGDADELSFDAESPGRPAQGSASRGVIDADGVAPVRHVDRRRAPTTCAPPTSGATPG
jgi:hypothetical protein